MMFKFDNSNSGVAIVNGSQVQLIDTFQVRRTLQVCQPFDLNWTSPAFESFMKGRNFSNADLVLRYFLDDQLGDIAAVVLGDKSGKSYSQKSM